MYRSSVQALVRLLDVAIMAGYCVFLFKKLATVRPSSGMSVTDFSSGTSYTMQAWQCKHQMGVTSGVSPFCSIDTGTNGVPLFSTSPGHV